MRVKKNISHYFGYVNDLRLYEKTGNLFSAGKDGIIKEWDLNNFNCIRTFPANLEQDENMIHMVIVRDKLIASSYGSIYIWNLRKNKKIFKFKAAYRCKNKIYLTLSALCLLLHYRG